MGATTPEARTPPRSAARILGLDLARAAAIVGMVIVNFKIVMGAEGTEPAWLDRVTGLLEGRAAATFVILAGIGASLGSTRARTSGDTAAMRDARITLAKRGLFLFVLGSCFYPIWPADILHFYGAYLAVGALVLFTPNRHLIGLAIASAGVSLAFVASFDFFASWDLRNLSYVGITTPSGFVRHLLLDGFHPVFPWVGFYLFGMWLGRTDLRDPARRRRLAVAATACLAASETLSAVVVGTKGTDLDRWQDLFRDEPLPPLPLYVVAAGATAVIVILAAIWIGERLDRRLLVPFVSTGQLALSLYIAHVIIGMGVLEGTGRLYDETIGFAVAASLAFSAGAVLFAWAWRQRWRRGPLEALMRRLAG